MSFLSIAQDVTAIVGIEQPSSIAALSTTGNGQIRALIQQATDELYSCHDWQALARIAPIVTIAGQRQPGFLPADYGRMAQGQTLWDTGRDEEVQGPLSPPEWAAFQTQGFPTHRRYWRFIGPDVWIYPATTAGETLSFEYLSKHTVRNAQGGTSDRWQADTDTSLLPERLIILGTIWKWKSSKGFAYAEDMATYGRELERATGAEAASGTLIVSDARRWPPDPLTGSHSPSGPFISSSTLKSSAI